jgi:hypothetical protein
VFSLYTIISFLHRHEDAQAHTPSARRCSSSHSIGTKMLKLTLVAHLSTGPQTDKF